MNETPKSHLIVAIARAKGCGGGSIGMEVARRLGCRYLDREILVEAARRMSRDPEALEAFDERCMSFWERTMVLALGSPGAPVTPPPLTLDDRDLFHIEKAIMKEAAQRGPVVIVGRMGFAVLRGEPGLLSVFLHAPLKERVQSMMRVLGIASEEEAKDLALRTERDRDEFVKTYTGKVRLDAKNYHLCIDTARFETDAVVGLICQAAQDVVRGLADPAATEKP